MAQRLRIKGEQEKRKPGRPKRAESEKFHRSAKPVEDKDPFECRGVFPSNEERIKYRDEMASRNYL